MEVRNMEWYFRVTSEEYGTEDYGPYDTRREATEALDRVYIAAGKLADDVNREYTDPFEREEEEEGS